MTPQEKAYELVDKYKNASFNCRDCDMAFCDIPCTMLNKDEAKECALIAVDEILPLCDKNKVVYGFFEDDYLTHYTEDFYWNKVKQEIEKL